MHDIKLKLIETDRQQYGGYQRQGGGGRTQEVKYMVMKDGLTLGGGHIIQYTDHVS